MGGTDIAEFTYEYDPNTNNIAEITYVHRDSNTVDYTYDNLDRLTLAEYSIDASNEAFTVDDLGNRDSVIIRDGNNVDYDIDNLTNRYDSVGGNTLAYDAAGNLTTDKDGYQYQYDYENRITKIIKSGPTTVAEFTYDALGRRIEKKDCITSANTRRYYYNDNWQVLCEYNAAGTTLQQWFAYGNYIDEVLMRSQSLSHSSSTLYYYVHDHLYSPVALVQRINSLVLSERYEYDAYGNCYVLEPNLAPDPDGKSDYGNPYFFTGRESDSLDNGDLKIMNYRHRTYDTYTGRFLTNDPVSYVDTMNLYEYVSANPSDLLDPYGLWGWHCGKDECAPGDIGYDILDTVIVPGGVDPWYRDAISIGDSATHGLDIATLVKIIAMLKMGMAPAEIIAELAKLGLDRYVIRYIRGVLAKIARDLEERNGNWMFLKVQLKTCDKDHYALFWRCYRYIWKPDGFKWYQCPGSPGGSVMGIYDGKVDAIAHIDDCKDTLDREFNDNRNSLRDLNKLWYK